MEIVPIGGLCGVNVPLVHRVAILHDPVHFLERCGNDRAAGFGATEEGVLVDLAGDFRMTHEDYVEGAVLARQKHVQEHEEALRQILMGLGHRRGGIHETEHHGLCGRLRQSLEPVVTKIVWIDIGDGLHASAKTTHLQAEFVRPFRVIRLFGFRDRLLQIHDVRAFRAL